MSQLCLRLRPQRVPPFSSSHCLRCLRRCSRREQSKALHTPAGFAGLIYPRLKEIDLNNFHILRAQLARTHIPHLSGLLP
jgi:hypothetical protein